VSMIRLTINWEKTSPCKTITTGLLWLLLNMTYFIYLLSGVKSGQRWSNICQTGVPILHKNSGWNNLKWRPSHFTVVVFAAIFQDICLLATVTASISCFHSVVLLCDLSCEQESVSLLCQFCADSNKDENV